MVFKPSKYQKNIFEWTINNTTQNAVVEAVAGSGKTTTTVKTLEFVDGGMQTVFLAFNKHIATELQNRLPATARAMTYHSLGFAAIRKNFGRVNLDEDKVQKIVYKMIDRYSQGHLISPIKRLVSLCKNNLLLNPSPDVLEDLAYYHQLDLNGSSNMVFDTVSRTLQANNNQTNSIDFDDMVSLPSFLNLEMSKYDFLAIDELQDTNAAQADLVMKSVSQNGRILGVGDTRQCQTGDTWIKMEGGGNKRLSDIKIGDKVVSYDRHAAAFVGTVNQGRKVLDKQSRKYTGKIYEIFSGGYVNKCTSNHKWLVRFTERATNKFVTYLMKKGNNYRVGWCQLFNPGGTNHLAQRSRIEGADAAWILSVFDNKEDASLEESFVSAFYGLPTAMFKEAQNNIIYTQKRLDNLFTRLNDSLHYSLGESLQYRADRCLEAHNRKMEYPFYTHNERGRQGRTTLFITQACNLLPGMMSVPMFQGTKLPKWTPITEIKIHAVKNVEVFSLKIDTHEMYVANNIGTHNSIYSFRGADSEAIAKLVARTNAMILPLSISYRCPRSVVQLVNQEFPDIKFEASDTAIEGKVEYIKESAAATMFAPNDMILCRTNAPLVSYCFQLIRDGYKAIIKGRDIGKGIIALMDKMKTDDVNDCIAKLNEYQMTEGERLAQSGKFGLLQAMDDKVTTAIALLMDCKSVSEARAKTEQIFSDENAAITLSSVHRAKGLEANRVFVLHPELMPHPMAKLDWMKQQEFNIKYVCYTRALQELYIVQAQ